MWPLGPPVGAGTFEAGGALGAETGSRGGAQRQGMLPGVLGSLPGVAGLGWGGG